jgi:CRISPR-associated protein Csx3
MVNSDQILITNSLPAVLIGGAPNAGKSVLTYNLTKKLRQLNIPHYVFRANPDYEGDWFLEADPGVVRQIYVEDYRYWSDIFRQFVCRDLSRRLLPLIVDIGGLPNEKDHCIFRACTHSLLLLKDGEEPATQSWRDYTRSNGLLPLAEIRSQLSGESTLTSLQPVIMGTITGLERGNRINGPVFDALVERIGQLFSSYSPAELERLHLDAAPLEDVVHLPQWLNALAPASDEWTPELLPLLLAELPAQTPLAVYGRGPLWVYGTLALHAKTKPFYQFDPRLGWVSPPELQTGTFAQAPQPVIHLEQHTSANIYTITVRPVHNYLDYTEAGQLVFPEPPPHHGVIINGKLPFWLVTALARFYAQRNVPWIALNYARINKACVVYSQGATPGIGDIIPLPT